MKHLDQAVSGPDRRLGRVGGRTYYFLWSLERVAVALDLDTIGKKDWYGWGAEILLENQAPNGAGTENILLMEPILFCPFVPSSEPIWSAI